MHRVVRWQGGPGVPPTSDFFLMGSTPPLSWGGGWGHFPMRMPGPGPRLPVFGMVTPLCCTVAVPLRTPRAGHAKSPLQPNDEMGGWGYLPPTRFFLEGGDPPQAPARRVGYTPLYERFCRGSPGFEGAAFHRILAGEPLIFPCGICRIAAERGVGGWGYLPPPLFWRGVPSPS
jgi:hypothetical protein